MSHPAARGFSRSEQDRAFLQRRVALFGLIIAGGYLFFLAYRSVVLLVSRRFSGFLDPTFWWHLAAGIAFSLLWAVARRGTHSVRFLHSAELGALTIGVGATGAMALSIPLESRPDFVMLLILSNVVLGRAILVPSSGRWTATLGIVVGAVLLACVYLGASRLDPGRWSAIYPELTARSRTGVALGVTLEIAVWWAITIMLSTATSIVIYGLRRRVRDAEQLGQYRLEEKLGEGGMGTVYRASHALLRRPTAVKLLPPARAGVDNIRRFEQEVQLTAQLRHPHTITIFDYGHTADGLFYYAMEYVDGLTLSDVVSAAGPQEVGRVVHLMRQASSALAEAHGVGLVHRDIKPGNIMVHLLNPHGLEGDFVKVLDFGLVKEMRREGGLELTNEANLAGTPLYMAPESLTAPDQVDGRADLYALGCVTYYLLTGTHVFSGESVVEVCGHHLHTAPESPSSRLGRSIPSGVESLVMRCLSKDPTERPQTASELEQSFARCAETAVWTHEDARRWWSAHGRREPGGAASPVVEARAFDVDITVRGDLGRR